MIVNGYGTQRTLATQREEIESAIARHRDKLARDHIEATRAAERYEFEQRQALAAEHAKNVAAEARARDTSIMSWQGAVAALFLLALTIGVFLIANYLGT
jgi:hypothetical protein